VKSINTRALCGKNDNNINFNAQLFQDEDPRPIPLYLNSCTGWRKKNACFFNLPAISFFGVTSNQKFTFANLVQSTT